MRMRKQTFPFPFRNEDKLHTENIAGTYLPRMRYCGAPLVAEIALLAAIDAAAIKPFSDSSSRLAVR